MNIIGLFAVHYNLSAHLTTGSNLFIYGRQFYRHMDRSCNTSAKYERE